LLWSEILRKVPSPNADDKPDVYEEPSAAEKYRHPTRPASSAPTATPPSH
jgi:hypothetical protein